MSVKSIIFHPRKAQNFRGLWWFRVIAYPTTKYIKAFVLFLLHGFPMWLIMVHEPELLLSAFAPGIFYFNCVFWLILSLHFSQQFHQPFLVLFIADLVSDKSNHLTEKMQSPIESFCFPLLGSKPFIQPLNSFREQEWYDEHWIPSACCTIPAPGGATCLSQNIRKPK